ncbi:MAG: hypothetical protein JWN86_3313 [Planctomycetota bacterium]|nr:hypothetical protein [Planctomycetota bacterium]
MTGDTPPPPLRTPSRPRFSLRGLMVACFYAAFALAAVLHPSTLAANFLQATMVCLLVAASVSAVLGRGTRRSFCIGFATFGFAYLALAWLSREGSPTLMATSRLVYRLLPGNLSLQDQPAFFASCTAIETAAYATLGGATAWLVAVVLRRVPRSRPVSRR